ncbi:MAG: class I SAM-dependent methyltransferase [Elusimicrobia bacterium]|nr:class I SAM-dependent methyltransferase [Elusimicrobiota bacterium]
MSLGDWWKRAFEDGVYPLSALAAGRTWRERTLREISFAGRLFGPPGNYKILDLCCGVGRHSLELARRGYRVTGVDISSKYLAEARRQARLQKISVEFLRRDMRRVGFERTFDAVINLYTSFGYFSRASDDYQVLCGVYRALKPGGKFLLEIANYSRVLEKLKFDRRNNLDSSRWSEIDDGTLVLEDSLWLPQKGLIRVRWLFLKGARRQEMTSYVRPYESGSLTRLLRKAGFTIRKVMDGLSSSPFRASTSGRLAILAQKPPAR